MAGTTRIGRVDIGLKLESIDQAISEKTIRMVMLFILLALCLITVLSGFFQQLCIKPIQDLTQYTRKVAQGDFVVFDAGGRDDEIGYLAQNFNEMSMSLKELYGGLESKVREHTNELEKTNMELQDMVSHAERMARKAEEGTRAKSQFLAAMSHEIRTPMNSVLGMAEALAETALTGEQKSYLNVIQGSGTTLLGLIDDILDLSKIESGDVVVESIPFQIEDVLAHVFSVMSYAGHAKALDLDYMIAPEIPGMVLGDSYRLQQILMNLVSNGIKFTHAGAVHVEVDVLSRKGTGFGSSVVLQFLVRDSGIGIVPEALDSIFDKFTQADSSTTRNYGGSGLGLAICKSLCEMMGGKIAIESEVGVGTNVLFNLPFDVARETAPGASPLSGKHLLLVDDRDRLQERLAARIRGWGGSIVIREDLESAVTAVESEGSGETYDAVVVNTPLGGKSWRNVAAEMVQRGLDPQRIILLTSEPAEDAGDFYSIGGILTKPPGMERLKATMEKMAVRNLQPQKTLRSLEILLVEDNEANVMLIEVYLKDMAHTLSVAHDGQEGFSLYREKRFDIVFMDIEMPVLDGYGSTRMIRQWERENRKSPVRIIALTAHALNEVREKALDAGCNSHLTKPVSKEAFLRALRIEIGRFH